MKKEIVQVILALVFWPDANPIVRRIPVGKYSYYVPHYWTKKPRNNP